MPNINNLKKDLFWLIVSVGQNIMVAGASDGTVSSLHRRQEVKRTRKEPCPQ
jgi:hypothetical protein